MKLSIRNFEALSHVDVEFPHGLVMLEGSNSVGKSALIRSVWSVLYSGFAASSLKSGQTSGKIKMQIDDKWAEVGKNTSGVYFNLSDGRKFERCGRDYLGGWEYLGFPSKDDASMYNFAMQGSSFVVKGGQLYSVLFGDVEKVRSVVTSCKRQNSSAKKIQDEVILQMSSEIELLEQLKEQLLLKSELQSQIEEINIWYTYIKQVKALEDLKDKLLFLNVLIHKIEERDMYISLKDSILTYLNTIKGVQENQKKLQDLTILISLLEENEIYKSQKVLVSKIIDYHKIKDSSIMLKVKMMSLEKLIILLQDKEELQKVLLAIKDVYKLKGLQQIGIILQSKLQSITELGVILRIKNYISIKQGIQFVRDTLSSIDINVIDAGIELIKFCQLHERQRDLFEKLPIYREQIEIAVNELGICPTCGTKLELKNIIGGRVK